jgi:anti-sigma B factor antagonist
MPRWGEHRYVEDREAKEDREARDEPLRAALRPRGPVQFRMTLTQEPEHVRIQIWGELDVLTTPRLSSELNRLVHRGQGDVVVDLRTTEFIDSAGLQILLSAQRRLSRLSRRLTVVCDEGPVRRVFEMTRLAEPLGLTRNEGEKAG